MPNRSGTRATHREPIHPRVVEVARRLRSPRWVKRYCHGNVSVATDHLARNYGFEGHESLMLVLCMILENYPDRDSFDREVARLFEHHRAQ